MVFLTMYVVALLLRGLILDLASWPWFIGGSVIVVLMHYIIGVGGMFFLATFCEGCDSLGYRFCGPGSSRGFWYGNLVYACAVAVGAYGLKSSQFVVNDVWLLGSAAVAGILLVVIHAVDGLHYGHEKAGEPRSTNSSPTKLYHDFIYQGVYWYLHFTTWLAYAGMAAWSIWHGQEITVMMSPLLRLGVCLAMFIVVVLCSKGNLDYARLHPANWRELNAKSIKDSK